MNNKKYTSFVALFIANIIILTGCSDESWGDLIKAPESSIERDIKGHEQIFSIQAKLRLALKHKDDENYSAFELWDLGSTRKQLPVPVYQEINMSKDFSGNIRITSDRKCFDVVKSKEFSYALELKYYDINGKLINHQFSRFDEKEPENSTLMSHQHFFTLQNYSLDGRQLLYPLTLDNMYYDKFMFLYDNDNRKIPSTVSSSSNVYVPDGHQGTNTLKYDFDLANQAIKATHTSDATKGYTYPQTGLTYHMFRSNGSQELNKLTTEIFTYEYRDTDPVEEWLGDPIFMEDDLGRFRMGSPVLRLRQERSLLPGKPYDALGFKGLLNFKHDNLIFQMRVCICHILLSSGKYDLRTNPGGLHEHNQMSPAWNSFDIDYPLEFRVIADIDGDKNKAIDDIKRFYPEADDNIINEMFWNGYVFFERKPQLTI